MSGKTNWVQKSFSLLFIIFCTELGLFLLLYPWSDRWAGSLFPANVTALRAIWLNPYFRGAISGVGMLNLWIALTEVFRLRRFGDSTSN